MKRIILPLCLLLLCGCQNNEINTNKIIKNKVSKESIVEKEEPKYVDNNPIKISLYLDGVNGGLDKVSSEYSTTWVKKKDIVVFDSVYSDESSLKGGYFQDVWHNAAEKYDTYKDYKTGWQVSFELLDGTKINQMIYKPSDVENFYDYLEIYLYDSANVAKNTFYSHLLDNQMTDDTVMTTIKLTAGSKFEEINGPIHLMVFTYDDDDFSEDGSYIGNSYFKTSVINSNNN